MSEKGTSKEKETFPKVPVVKKQQGRYSGGSKKKAEVLNTAETGIRQSRGKKQRRQFKMAPNRG